MAKRIRNILRLTAIIVSVSVAVRSLADDRLPDSRGLLIGVEQDRLAIKSGRMELDVASSSGRSPYETARTRLVLVFDGERCRIDQEQRALMIDWIRGPESTVEKRNFLLASWGDPEAIVRAGLGCWIDLHGRVICDGAMLMSYSQGKIAFLSDSKKGTGDFIFDPRTLGLSPTANMPSRTAGMFLSPRAGGSVSLVGRESVGGVSVWHVLVGGGATGLESHFWVDLPPGHRLYKAEYRGRDGRSVIVSEYDPPDAGDAGRLPVRVKAVTYEPSGKVAFQWDLERSPGPKSVEFNVTIDPETWTLAGLGMPIGETVYDRRAGREIGRWDGQGISETYPAQPPKGDVVRPRPNVAKLLEVAKRDPGTPLAIDAIAEIVRIAPSASESRDALGVLAKYNAGAKGAGAIGLQSIDTQPESTETLFRTILEKNPAREDQGHASFGLAEILKARSEQTGLIGTEEAERLFERVVSSYGDVRRFGWHPSIGESARVALSDLRSLGIGKTAPFLDGMDLDDKPLRLIDYRGKVVVVNFWATWCRPCLAMVPQERELVKRMKGKPFALLGVSGDEKKSLAKATQEKESMTWPTLWLGEGLALISDRWGLRSVPTIYVLDAKGIIRFKNLRGDALNRAVDSLLEEVGR